MILAHISIRALQLYQDLRNKSIVQVILCFQNFCNELLMTLKGQFVINWEEQC